MAKSRTTDQMLTREVQQTSVIVEMTPFYRTTFRPGWKLAKVQQLEGRQVKVEVN
jgi:hypothetical protein